MAHSLTHLEPPAAVHERRGPLEVQIVEAREPQAPDLQEVAKASRREQPGAGAAALEEALVATVVPWMISATAPGSRLASASSAAAPSMIASA
jgi:hypothetical protein